MLPLISIVMTVLGTAPIHTLRPVLFRLVQDGVLPRVHSQLLRALQETAAGNSMEYLIPHRSLQSSASPYASFRDSIVRQLFGDDTLLRLRLKLAITDFCWVRSPLFPSFPAFCLYLFNLPLRFPYRGQPQASRTELSMGQSRKTS